MTTALVLLFLSTAIFVADPHFFRREEPRPCGWLTATLDAMEEDDG